MTNACCSQTGGTPSVWIGSPPAMRLPSKRHPPRKTTPFHQNHVTAENRLPFGPVELTVKGCQIQDFD
jgi:hypothetical protein